MKIRSFEKADSNRADLVRRFSDELLRYANLSRQFGVEVIPYRNNFFHQLIHQVPLADIEAGMYTIKFSNGILNQVIKSEKSALNSKTIWSVVKHHNMKPCEGFLDELTSEDIVEVFYENRPIFRSVNFYDKSSYAVSDLVIKDWQDLFVREDSTNMKLLSIVNYLHREGKPWINNGSLPKHSVREADSPFKYDIEYDLKYALPLMERKGNRVVGFISVCRAKILNKKNSVEEGRLLREYYEKKNSFTQAL